MFVQYFGKICGDLPYGIGAHYAKSFCGYSSVAVLVWPCMGEQGRNILAIVNTAVLANRKVAITVNKCMNIGSEAEPKLRPMINWLFLSSE